MIKIVYCFLLHKYLKITSLIVFIFVLILSIFIFNDYLVISNYERIKVFYNNCFQYLLILNVVLGIFTWGYLNLKISDDYKKIIISSSKLSYIISKTLILTIYELVNIAIECIIVMAIGYLYTKIIEREIFVILLSLIIGSLFYSLISGILVLIFDAFNYIYISMGLFIVSFTNTLRYLIVCYEDIYLSCSAIYYIFILIIYYFIYVIIFMHKEIS